MEALQLSIYRVVAWRMAYMQRMGRTNLHLPARVLFSAVGILPTFTGCTVHGLSCDPPSLQGTLQFRYQ